MDEVRDAYRGVRRRWWWIAIAAAAALAAALIFLLLVPPRYVSTAQILIDPRAKRIVEGAVVQGGFGSSAAGADTLLIDSQIEIMQSTAVLKKIVETERLHEDKEFMVPPSSGGLRLLLRNTIGRSLFGNDREEVSRIAAAKVAQLFRSMVARGVPREQAQRFVLQAVVAMFAEDIDMMPASVISTAVPQSVERRPA